MKKVLIVDDDEITRELCKRILSKNSVIAETAENAKEALKILDSTFDLVITDLEMPGLDGLWLAKKIKEKFPSTSLRTGKEKIPVILMTGSIAERKNFSQPEVDDFLSKPFDVEDFLSVVSRHLG